jgi:hypothetical protein
MSLLIKKDTQYKYYDETKKKEHVREDDIIRGSNKEG